MKNIFTKIIQFIKNEPQLLPIALLIIVYILISKNVRGKSLFDHKSNSPVNTEISNNLDQTQNNVPKETNLDISPSPTQIPLISPSKFSVSGGRNSESENRNEHELEDN